MLHLFLFLKTKYLQEVQVSDIGLTILNISKDAKVDIHIPTDHHAFLMFSKVLSNWNFSITTNEQTKYLDSDFIQNQLALEISGNISTLFLSKIKQKTGSISIICWIIPSFYCEHNSIFIKGGIENHFSLQPSQPDIDTCIFSASSQSISELILHLNFEEDMVANIYTNFSMTESKKICDSFHCDFELDQPFFITLQSKTVKSIDLIRKLVENDISFKNCQNGFFTYFSLDETETRTFQTNDIKVECEVEDDGSSHPFGVGTILGISIASVAIIISSSILIEHYFSCCTCCKKCCDNSKICSHCLFYKRVDNKDKSEENGESLTPQLEQLSQNDDVFP